MGIKRVEMIFPLFYVEAQANNVRTDQIRAHPVLCALYCINFLN